MLPEEPFAFFYQLSQGAERADVGGCPQPYYFGPVLLGLAIGRKLTETVLEINKRGIIHADISPQNIGLRGSALLDLAEGHRAAEKQSRTDGVFGP